jgi:CheY-like chemotaxis protein
MEERPNGSRRRPATKRRGDATEAVGPEPSSSKVINRPRRALLVEAEPITLGLCRDFLEGAGFVVDAVDTGIAAVVAAREAIPDLILVDLQLRDVPGREAISWLRSNPALRSTPIIIITTNVEDNADVAATHADASLRRPVSPIMIQRTIREVL